MTGAVLVAVAGLVGAAWPGLAHAEHNVDHFKVYNNNDIGPFGAVFTLQDQFQNKVKSFDQDLTCDFYATPVVKKFSPTPPLDLNDLFNPDLHYAWYRFDTPRPEKERTVNLDNQFGEQTWQIQNSEYILSPSSKAVCVGGPTPGAVCTGAPLQGTCGVGGICSLGTIPNEDHYKCYEVLGFTPPDPSGPMFLLDQFHNEDNVPLGDPRYWCTPAEKVHNTNTFVIQNPDDHLACYDIPPDPLNVVFDAAQQFGPSPNLTTTNAEMLCVPSNKLEPVPSMGLRGFASLLGVLTLTGLWYGRRRLVRGSRS